MWDDDDDRSNGKNELAKAKCESAVDLMWLHSDGDKKDVAERRATLSICN